MVKKSKQKDAHRERKSMSVRSKLRNHARRPRLSVFRSLNNISVQVIDDEAGRTLAAASSLEKELRATKGLKKCDMAGKVGELIAQRATQAGITKVALDRGPYKYHGRIKALAEAARKGGLEF